MTKIYTKTGDKGETSLLGGTRVRKSHPRLEAYGTVDELNSFVGVLRAHLSQATHSEVSALVSHLQRIQHELFIVGSHLACEDEENRKNLSTLKEEIITILEKEMDRMTASLPQLKNFILPGGAVTASSAHVCRTVCRRAERLSVNFIDSEELQFPQASLTQKYLNRLSDYFFVLARYLNSLDGQSDIIWKS